MRSMTGFGVGGAVLGEGRLNVELRALNHRYLEIRSRVPADLSEQTFFIEQYLRERLQRGRFDVGVRVEGAVLGAPRFSTERARSLYRALAELRDELSPGTPLPVTALASVPALFEAPDLGTSESLRKALTAAIDQALGELETMRRQEGAALARELGQRAARILQHLRSIEDRKQELLEHHQVRLRERVARLLSDAAIQVDAGRLAVEVALLADKSDVTEELVRLKSHFEQFHRLLESDEAVGRKLEFLLQEVLREVNTIGSKSQDAPLSQLVVEIKAETERMREQVKNVE